MIPAHLHLLGRNGPARAIGCVEVDFRPLRLPPFARAHKYQRGQPQSRHRDGASRIAVSGPQQLRHTLGVNDGWSVCRSTGRASSPRRRAIFNPTQRNAKSPCGIVVKYPNDHRLDESTPTDAPYKEWMSPDAKRRSRTISRPASLMFPAVSAFIGPCWTRIWCRRGDSAPSEPSPKEQLDFMWLQK